MAYILERIDLQRDIHFQTNTTIDTLDYSGTGLNSGSKVVFAAYGDKRRELCREVPETLAQIRGFENPRLIMPGVVAIQAIPFVSYAQAREEFETLGQALAERDGMDGCPMIVVCDDSSFVSQTLGNFLWVTFTRSNPSHDIHGVNSFYKDKHWGCDNVIIDARSKPHQAPPLVPDAGVEKRIDRLFAKGGSLSGIL